MKRPDRFEARQYVFSVFLPFYQTVKKKREEIEISFSQKKKKWNNGDNEKSNGKLGNNGILQAAQVSGDRKLGPKETLREKSNEILSLIE